MRKIVALVLFLLVPSIIYAQPVINPTRAEFTPSPDHNTIENTVTLVTSYDLRIFQSPSGTTPVSITDIGKPTPVNNLITVPLGTITTTLPPGEYIGRVVAKGPGGETISEASNPFTITVRPPTAPSKPTFIR